MEKEEIVPNVKFHMLRREVGVANGKNDDVYVGVRCHASWINHAEEVNEDENLTVSCCMNGRGAG